MERAPDQLPGLFLLSANKNYSDLCTLFSDLCKAKKNRSNIFAHIITILCNRLLNKKLL